MKTFEEFKQKNSNLIINDALMIKGGACTDSYYWTSSKGCFDHYTEADGGSCPPKVQ